MYLTYLVIDEPLTSSVFFFKLFYDKTKAEAYIAKEPFADQDINLDEFDCSNYYWKIEELKVQDLKIESLLKDSQFLQALHMAGVDNWSGYGEAQDIMF